jgi:hypothetical protein
MSPVPHATFKGDEWMAAGSGAVQEVGVIGIEVEIHRQLRCLHGLLIQALDEPGSRLARHVRLPPSSRVDRASCRRYPPLRGSFQTHQVASISNPSMHLDTYDTDFYAWTNTQAELLRAGKLHQADIAQVLDDAWWPS